jgi:hypothetical protein
MKLTLLGLVAILGVVAVVVLILLIVSKPGGDSLVAEN